VIASPSKDQQPPNSRRAPWRGLPAGIWAMGFAFLAGAAFATVTATGLLFSNRHRALAK
jgi:hypothetical protein